MVSRHLLLLGLALWGYTGSWAQTELIPADMANLYQLTLAKSPTLQRQHLQTKRALADKQLAVSQFDYQLASNLDVNRSGLNFYDADPRKDIVSNLMNNDLVLGAGLQRTFRSGITAKVGLDYSRNSNNFPFNSFNENVGSFYANHATTTSLSLTQPLMRGRGTHIVTANEKAAGIGIESQNFNAAFVAAGEVFNTLFGYWQYLGAHKSLEIYQANEARVNKVLGITQELVKAEKKPSSDLLQIQADLKDKEQQTILAQQQLYSARQNLGRAVGLNAVEGEKIGQPNNDFPALDETSIVVNLAQLLEIARKNRSDLKALHKSLEIADIRVDVAKNNLKPQLDLTAYLGYGGAATGNGVGRFFTALGNNQGRNYLLGLGLNFLFPINNNRAEATLLTNQLLLSDQEVVIQNQIREIELNVSIALNRYLNSIAALKKSKESLAFYEEVFNNEQIKFQTGLTTLLNLILFQERLTFAQLDYIQNQQQFAIAIANLRYETGTLLTTEQLAQQKTIDPGVFYTLPKE